MHVIIFLLLGVILIVVFLTKRSVYLIAFLKIVMMSLIFAPLIATLTGKSKEGEKNA